jgi:hypothetical protein
MTFESKFAIGDPVYYYEPNRNIRHAGSILTVTFASAEAVYTIQTHAGTTHSVPESVIELRE